MGLYTATDFRKGDTIIMVNGGSFKVISDGVADAARLTVREVKPGGKLSSRMYRVDVKAVELRSPRLAPGDVFEPYTPDPMIGAERREETAVVRPIAPKPEFVLTGRVPVKFRQAVMF